MNSIEKYFTQFVAGMVEIIVVVVAEVMVKGFTAVKLPGLNWEPLLTYVAIFFIASIIINFIKGWLLPLNAIVNIAGMITMFILSNGVFWSIAPDAVIEIIAYIIAAMAGIYLGVRFRGAGQSQEQYYYL